MEWAHFGFETCFLGRFVPRTSPKHFDHVLQIMDYWNTRRDVLTGVLLGHHQGVELDLLMFKGSQRIGVEFKRADAPASPLACIFAMNDLKLDALYVVYPGLHGFKLAD